MDTRLSGGDHALDRRGIPEAVGGDAELIQRALIRLSVRRGSLAGAETLGSELYRLRSARPGLLRQLARGYVQEALAPMPELTVNGVDVLRDSGDGITVSVTLGRRRQTYQLEVQIP